MQQLARTSFRLVRLVWLIFCLFTIGFALYLKAVGEDAEIFCVLTMEMLTFPVGGICFRLVGKLAYAWVPGTGTFMTSGGFGPIIAVWFLYFVFGIIQWFWFVPRLPNWLKGCFSSSSASRSSVPVPPAPTSK